MKGREGIYAETTAWGNRFFTVWSSGLPYGGGFPHRFRYLWRAELAYRRFRKHVRGQGGNDG